MTRATRREWAIVVSAFVTLAMVCAVWLSRDHRPPEWDHANHLERMVACAEDLAKGDLQAILERSSFYPPLVPCLAAVVYRVAPSDSAAAQAVILFFLGIGMVAIYLLGRRLADGTAGTVAALLFASAPFVVFSSLNFQLDLPLAAITALALLVLLQTESFTRVGWSLIAGLVFGLGMLTKPPFAVYVLPALALVLWHVRARRSALNVILAGLVTTALSLPWYGPRLLGLPAQIGNRSFKQAAESGHPEPFTWAALSFYPRWFVTQFGVLAVLACCFGLVVAVRHRQGFLLVTLFVPLGLFALLQNKNLRYTLPLLPMAAILAGTGLAALRGRWRTVAGSVLLAVGALQVTGTAFGAPRGLTLPGIGVPWVLGSPPTRTDWRQREILALISRHSGGATRTVSVVPNFALFSMSNFSYYAVREQLPLRFQRAWDDEPVGIDYMVLKSGDVGPSWTADKPRRIAERFAADPDLARVFLTIGEFPLPDGSVATLRARSVPLVQGVSPATLAEAVSAGIHRALHDYARDVAGLRVALDYDAAILRGGVRRVVITAATATVGELRRRQAPTLAVRDLRLVVDDLLVNPYSAYPAGHFAPLDARRVTIEGATIGARDLQDFLHAEKEFRRASVRLEAGALDFVMSQPGLDVQARVHFVHATDRPFALAADHVRLGGVSVPHGLVNWVVRNYDPSLRIASRLPVRLEVGPITISADAIRISPADRPPPERQRLWPVDGPVEGP